MQFRNNSLTPFTLLYFQRGCNSSPSAGISFVEEDVYSRQVLEVRLARPERCNPVDHLGHRQGAYFEHQPLSLFLPNLPFFFFIFTVVPSTKIYKHGKRGGGGRQFTAATYDAAAHSAQLIFMQDRSVILLYTRHNIGIISIVDSA